MPDWLEQSLVAPPIPPATMALRIALALALGAVIAAVYRLSHGARARDASTLAATVVLLAGLLAMVTMVIGESVARAFGLVGALSIVRFRTVVEDTRDTAFVIFAVVVGMAVGTGLLMVAAVGVPLLAAAALLFSPRNPAPSPRSFTLTVRLALGRDPASLSPVIAAHARILRSQGARSARQGSALDLVLLLDIADDQVAPLALALNALDGVQEVDLEPVAP